MKGCIQIYCGDGKGKTTASIGLLIRAVGCGIPVVFSQFMKNDTSSEINIIKQLEQVSVFHCKSSFGFYFQMKEEEKVEAQKEYTELFYRIIQEAKEKAKNTTGLVLLIMDEIISAYNLNMVPQREVLEFLMDKPENLEVILTGREPLEELIELADYVSCVEKVKHPYDRGMNSRKGIEW